MNKHISVLMKMAVIMAIIAALIGSSGQSVLAENGFAGGSGTEEDPYLVATADQLNNVRKHLDKHFRQVADINLGLAPWSEGKGWQPIGQVSHPLHFEQEDTFSGAYDGNGFKISNLSINLEHLDSMGGLGLFGVVGEGGLLERVRLDNVALTSLNYTGALAGINQGTVRGCSTSGNIEDAEGFAAKNVGGLVGENAGLITQSSSAVTVKSYGNFAGLVGRNEAGATIRNCFSTGDVNLKYSQGFNGGGLVGYSWPTALIENCYTTGKVGDSPGTLFALVTNFDTAKIISTYFNVNAYGLTEPVEPHGKTTQQMKQQATFVGWDFVNIWQIDEGFSFPYFRPFTPSSAPVITSPAQETFTVGQPGSFTIDATGSPLPHISLTGTLPAGLNFTLGTGTATINGTIADSSGGVYPLTIKAANGIAPDATQAFTLTVRTVKPIGGGGGTIDSNGGALTVAVPVGSVEDGTEFTLVPQSQPGQATGNLSFSGTSFQLTAKDGQGDPITSFDPPLVVTIQYDPAALGGIPEETLMLYTWDGTTWVDAACGDYDRSVPEQFTVAICHLSEFAVLGEAGGDQIYLPLILQ